MTRPSARTVLLALEATLAIAVLLAVAGVRLTIVATGAAGAVAGTGRSGAKRLAAGLVLAVAVLAFVSGPDHRSGPSPAARGGHRVCSGRRTTGAARQGACAK